MKKIVFILPTLILFILASYSAFGQKESTKNEETHIRIVKKNKDGKLETIEHNGNLSKEEIEEIFAEHGISDIDIDIDTDGEIDINSLVSYADPGNDFFRMGKKKILGLGVVFDQSYSNNLIAENVMDNSPADEGGINKGDVFVSIDGKSIESLKDLKGAIEGKKVGDQVELEILRYGKIEKREIRLDSIVISDFKSNSVFNFDNNTFWMDNDNSFKLDKGLYGKPKLGVIIEDDKDGVIVNKVFPGSLAEELGIVIDDVITEVNDQTIELTRELREVLKDLKEGDPLKLKIKRKNKKITVKGNL